MSAKLLRGAADLLIGPRPSREVLKTTSQIPGFTPTTGREALYAGANQYKNEAGEVIGVQELGNPKRMNKAGDPLSAFATKNRAKRRANRSKIPTDGSYRSQREKDMAEQTEGANTFEEKFDSDGGKFEAHHRSGLKQYRPFFQGLSKEEQAKMRAFLKERGVFTGNKAANNYGLPKEVHSAFHNAWERNHSLLLKDDFFKDTPLKQRMEAADIYVQSIQQAYDEAAFAIVQGYNRGMGIDELMKLAQSL